jgi:hypothetical protein
MSIDDEIIDRCNRGMLFPLLPEAQGATVRRAMLIGEELYGLLNSPQGDEEWEERIGTLRADLEHFVTSESIHSRYLFLLSPARDSVWEIRSVQNAPSIRVLGLFPAFDVFVATNFAKRAELGGWESLAWKHVKRLARAVWRQVFPAYDPVNTSDVHEVVSGAIDGKFCK